MEGHREVGEVGEEEIVLRMANVVLEGVVEHCPILSQGDLWGQAFMFTELSSDL